GRRPPARSLTFKSWPPVPILLVAAPRGVGRMAVVWRADAEVDRDAGDGDQVAYVRRLGEAVRSGLEARRHLDEELLRYERLGSAVLPALGRVAQACAHEFDQAVWVVTV